jgi:hypothetical protein
VAEKLTFIDCHRAVQRVICPGDEDCEAEARAQYARVPRGQRTYWLLERGCSPATIERRARLLAKWKAEPKKPVRASTKLRWELERFLSDMGCLLVAPFCMAARQARRQR